VPVVGALAAPHRAVALVGERLVLEVVPAVVVPAVVVPALLPAVVAVALVGALAAAFGPELPAAFVETGSDI